MTGFLPILHSKPLKRVFPNLLGTLVGSVRLGNGANWITYSKLPTGDCGKKGNFVFDFKHFWDALQTFKTFWDFMWMFGTSQCGYDCE